ncbi:UNVERIFIED_CONTAM: NAC domain-containing protein 10 [Sesamum latifolium]|uniref:NAC domain-containing protein 10 n=1 Tax=Sesamum latifolium TaxID=2727402 RepID=A0AAW2XLA6_9LAMI
MSSICMSSNINTFVNVDAFVREEEQYPSSSRSAMNLPIGYRFLPTDDELIVHYLKRKVYNQPQPYNNIPTFNLYEFTPENLCVRGRELAAEARGLTGRLHTDTGRRLAATGPSNNGEVVGYRNTLVYIKRKSPASTAKKTDWIMHEYRLKDLPSWSTQQKTITGCRMRSCYAESTTTIKNIDETAVEQLDTQKIIGTNLPTVEEEDQQQQQIFSAAPETSHCTNPLAQDDFDGIDEPLTDKDLEFLYDIINM